METIKEQLVSILTSCLTLFSVISKCHFGSLEFQIWHFEILLLFLFVIVRIVNTLHKCFAVVDLVGQSRLQKSLNLRRIDHALLHRIEVIVLIDSAPIDTLLQLLFENQIKPNASTATITLTEWVSDCHIY